MDAYSLVGPLIRCLDPETAHRTALWAARLGFAAERGGVRSARLTARTLGMSFQNPIGMAAGWDKNAEAIAGTLSMGFGFIEIGGVTPLPQAGNPAPRLFRLPADRAIINRMGFNNQGAEAIAARLAAWRARKEPGLVAVNLGKNKDSVDAAADYVSGAKLFAPLADFLVLNVSSPNTPGLRSLQQRAALADILAKVKAVSGPTAVLLKIAPDISEDDEADIAAVAVEGHADGLVISNTTLARPESLRSAHRNETGGLSGPPLFAPSTALLGRMYVRTEGRLPLIGVGGVSSGAEAYAKIRAGASLVQLYTALVYQGPGLLGRIKRDLLRSLDADGFVSIAEAVGADHPHVPGHFPGLPR